MIGKLIRQRREAKGLSQIELGQRIGTSQRQISRWENGSDTMLPRRETLEKLGAALDITLPEFYTAAGVIEGSGDARELPPPGRTIVVNTVDGTEEFDLDEVVRFVESRPGAKFQRDLAEARADFSREDYEGWVADLFGAWLSNANVAVKALFRARPHHEGQD